MLLIFISSGFDINFIIGELLALIFCLSVLMGGIIHALCTYECGQLWLHYFLIFVVIKLNLYFICTQYSRYFVLKFSSCILEVL